jgi:hypothetical protein
VDSMLESIYFGGLLRNNNQVRCRSVGEDPKWRGDIFLEKMSETTSIALPMERTYQEGNGGMSSS